MVPDLHLAEALHGEDVSNRENDLLKFPNEITCAIFLLALADYAVQQLELGRTKPAKHSSGDSGINLNHCLEVDFTHVCRYWRSTALAFPALWTKFRFIARGNSQLPVDRLNTYLDRSRDQPLDVYFDLRKSNNPENFDNLFDEPALVSYAGRLRRLTIIPRDTFAVVKYLRMISMPNLELLAIAPGKYCEDVEEIPDAPLDEEEFLEPMTLLDGAAKLSRVFMNPIATLSCMPSLSSVTTLQIEDMDCNTKHKITFTALAGLLGLPFLEHISLKFSKDQLLDKWPLGTPPPTGFPASIKMPKVKSMRLSTSPAFCQVLLYIKAPVLEQLTLKDMGPIISRQRPPAEYPMLRRLHLVRCMNLLCIPNSYITVARLFPHVVSLVISASSDLIAGFSGPPDALEKEARSLRFKTWSALRTVTLDLTQASHLHYYLNEWTKASNPTPFTLRVPKDVFAEWKARYGPERLSSEGDNAYDVIEELDAARMELLQREAKHGPFVTI